MPLFEPLAAPQPIETVDAKALRAPNLSDAHLLDLVQRQTFRFFWEGGHPVSGLARDRSSTSVDPDDDIVGIGGSGFGIMAMIVAVERGWISRDAALERLGRMLDVLSRATCYHGMFPHFMNGRTGATIPFGRKDDGGDIVETALLFQGLLCARAYFDRDVPQEKRLRQTITNLWQDTEWSWHTQDGRKLLYWHWSPNNGWSLDHEIHGWNECLITYVLAAASPSFGIDPEVYHRGFAAGRDFLNGKTYEGIELPLGQPYGGPLFFTQYSFCGLDPRGLKDRYADYFEQNLRHARIQHAYCVRNPHGYKGYGPACWGLTASDDPDGYVAHAPDLSKNGTDTGVISPTAALSSFPYTPDESMAALRHFSTKLGGKIWGRYGFVDGFSESRDWYAKTFLAIDQGPIVVMIENFRSGLMWNLFMRIPEIQTGLARLGFTTPYASGLVA